MGMAWEADMGRGVPLLGKLLTTMNHQVGAGLGDPRPKHYPLSKSNHSIQNPYASMCINPSPSTSLPPKKSKTPPYHTTSPPKKKGWLYIVKKQSFRVVPGRWKGLCGGTAGIRSVLRALEGCEAVASPSASRFRGGMTCQQRRRFSWCHVFPQGSRVHKGWSQKYRGLSDHA